MLPNLEKAAEIVSDRRSPGQYVRTLTWIVASNVSLLSTKYLLTRGYNYPLHLLLAHLAAAIAVEVIHTLVGTFIDGPRATVLKLNTNTDRERCLRILLGLFAYLVTAAAATMMAYQALEHFGTFSAVATSLICVTLPWDVYRRINNIDKRAACYLTLFMVSILSIGVLDAKLTFKGVGSAVLAIGFATATKAQDRWIGPHWKSQESTMTTIQQRVFSLLAFIVALVVAALSCLRWETPIYSPLMGGRIIWVLITNIISSALAFKLGWSPLWILSPRCDSQDEQDLVFGAEPSAMPSWIALVTTSTATALFPMGFPMNQGQYACCFLMMESAITMQKRSCTDGREQYAVDEDDAARMSLLPSEEAAIGPRASPDSHDTEANRDSKLSSYLAPSCRTKYTSSFHLGTLLRASTMLALCLGLTYSSTERRCQKPEEKLTPKIGYATRKSIDLVVSYYDEPIPELGRQLLGLINLPTLSPLDISIVVYNKGNSTQNADLETDLNQLTGVMPEVVARPNIGKESETYLHHMVSRWDELADHTFFMQAHMHNFYTSQQRINQYFVARTAFLPLSPLEICTSFEGCTDHSTWSEESGILERIFAEAHEDQKFEALLLTYRGQFIASSSQIRAGGQQHYLNLLTELRDEKSYTHSKGYADRPWMPGKKDEMNAPLFGFTLERMWPAIMRCSELRISRDCPSLASGFLRSFVPGYSVQVEDCQCLDDI